VHSEAREDRNVIPRWRPLITVEQRDLKSVGRFLKETHSNCATDYSNQLEIWRKEDDLSAASDIFDTFILTGDRRLLLESVRMAERHNASLPPRMKHSLAEAFSKKIDPLERRKDLAAKEMDEAYLIRSVAIIKKRLVEFPRDALSHLEIARLYTILGQFKQAESSLFAARALAPDDRVILRATLQFYDIVAGLDDGLKIIRRSSRLQYDPWIQSAEVATSTLLGKSSQIAKKVSIYTNKDGLVNRDQSELAMALATLDRAAGVKERKIFQLVKKALPLSTENGFSQAIWLSDQSSREFVNRFPDAMPSSEAYEAKVRLSIDKKEFEDARTFARFWAEDQPFSIDAIIEYLYLASVHSSIDDRSVKFAVRAMNVYSDNWNVLNACVLVFAEAKDFINSDIALQRLDREAPAGAPRSFVEAARGFVSFSKGSFIDGRAFYERATRIAMEYKRYDLLINATMFWLRCEAQNGLISASYIDEMKGVIEKALDRVKSQSDKSYLQNIWHSVQQKMAVSTPLEFKDSSSNLRDLAIENLDDPRVLLLGFDG
jgi:tetratricopeptide (TPR) repeat protein